MNLKVAKSSKGLKEPQRMMNGMRVRSIGGESFIQRAVADTEKEAKQIAERLRKTSRRKIRILGLPPESGSIMLRFGVYAGPSRSVRKTS